MHEISVNFGVATARCGTGLTLVCLALTLGCEPSRPVVSCRADRDCPSYAAFCGCDGLCAASTATTTDAGVGVPSPITVVLARFRALPTNDDASEFGIDLDGQIGGGCGGADDFTSPITGAPGIDNQLSTLSPTIDSLVGGDGWNGALDATVLDGTELIALEITALGDGCMRNVHAWTAHVEGGSVAPDPSCPTVTNELDCEARNSCFWSPTQASCAGIAGAQTWRTMDDLGEVRARLVGGRLHTAPFDALPLLPTIAPMGTTSVLAPLTMHGVVLEADLVGTTLERGEIGGAIAVTDAVAWTNAHLLPPPYSPIADATFRDLAQPDLTPSTDGSTCNGLSAGLGFETVPATLVH